MTDPARRRLTALAEQGLRSATLLHELRQSVFAIKAMAQLARLEGRPLGANDIEQLLTWLAHLEGLLDEHDPVGVAEIPSVFDLHEAVRDAVRLLEPRRRVVDARVDVALCPGALHVRARPLEVRRVLVNLLGNALDAVEGHERRRVGITSEALGDTVRVVLHDSGAGIPAAVRPRLFEPFVTTKPPGRGTGLGLFVARQLVEEAAGRLEISCPDAGGTRAVVSLPAAWEAQFTSSSLSSSEVA